MEKSREHGHLPKHAVKTSPLEVFHRECWIVRIPGEIGTALLKRENTIHSGLTCVYLFCIDGLRHSDLIPEYYQRAGARNL